MPIGNKTRYGTFTHRLDEPLKKMALRKNAKNKKKQKTGNDKCILGTLGIWQNHP